MIKIIAGIYGYRNPETGSVEAKTPKSEPFACGSAEEERLVRLGVAEYAAGSPTAPPDEPGESTTEDLQLEMMTKKQLIAIAEQIGIEIPKKPTNKELITLIETTQAEDGNPDDEDDSEGAPELSAAMPQ